MDAINFIDVKKEFQDGDITIQALKTTNFSVSRGEFTAIIGPSGSGKSTFLTLAGGLQLPTSGNILLNGTSFAIEKEKLRAQMRFREIGFVLQASNLIPFLSIENQFKLVDKINKKNNTAFAESLFEELDILKLKKKYPEEISGGERQRVAIARALYNKPSIILADEPTASLDSDRAYDVINILARETKERDTATIMVTHDLRLIDKCDSVYVMKDGTLTKDS